ncbi:MAG: LptA/OstA family protein [Candidatus Sericytochromatia bacterium]|nr:LptA/OstA family protein [Candidatus Sericytochromatia bacterium]
MRPLRQVWVSVVATAALLATGPSGWAAEPSPAASPAGPSSVAPPSLPPPPAQPGGGRSNTAPLASPKAPEGGRLPPPSARRKGVGGKPARGKTPAGKPSKGGPQGRAPGGKPSKAKGERAGKAKDERIHLTSDYLKYDRKARRALASGKVKIVQEDTVIRTEEVQFDQAAKTSFMNQPVQVTQRAKGEPATTLDAKRMTIYHREKRLIAEGEVHFVRARNPLAKPATSAQRDKVSAAIKKEDTVITSDELEYWTQRKDAHFKGTVAIVNGKKKAWSDSAFMDRTRDETRLEGHVKVVQINGNWLVKEGIVKADKPDEARDEALRERATLWCDKLVIDNRTSDAVATGEVVRIEQKGKIATGRRAVLSDLNHTITLTENVRVQQANGDWLTASRAVFNTQTEVFEAFSGGQTQVQTEFDPTRKGASPSPGGQVELDVDVEGTDR